MIKTTLSKIGLPIFLTATLIFPVNITQAAMFFENSTLGDVVVNKENGGENKHVPAENIILNPSNLAVWEGYGEALKATILPTNATDKTIIWKSSNEEVAKVISEGIVVGISPGTAKITAALKKDPSKFSTTEVVVSKAYLPMNTQHMRVSGNDITITGAELLPRESDFIIGDISQLLPVIKAVSTTPDVVNLDVNTGNLIIKPISEGTTKITATIFNKNRNIEQEVPFDAVVHAANINHPPSIQSVGTWGLILGQNPFLSFSGTNLAKDEDGDPLTVTKAKTKNHKFVELYIVKGKLFIIPKSLGTATITATITDSMGASVDHTFNVVVKESFDN